MQRKGAHNKLGETGEELAAEFLISKEYRIMARNLRLKTGEIDILAQGDDSLVVVEVKTRTSSTFIDPVFALSPAKIRKLRLLASIIAAQNPGINVRIDGIIVSYQSGKPELTWLQNIA